MDKNTFLKLGGGRCALWLVLALIALPVQVGANEYSPPGYYDVERVRLDNGLQVLLKDWGHARSTSLRLVVGVGTRDLPCAEAQIPHLLEHIVFEGTEAHPEPGNLDNFLDVRGAYKNASTESHKTVYEIDIYGPEAPAAVDALHQMAHAALFTEQAIESEKATVHRELGSDASSWRRWLYARGIGQSGGAKAWEALGFRCPGMARVDAASRERLLEFYRQQYVAANMTLVVVGQFDREAVLKRIQATFGSMPDTPPSTTEAQPRALRTGPTIVASTLSPVLGSEASASLIFPTAGYLSDDYPVLIVISEHLDGVLFDRVRREAGLAYAPGAGMGADRTRGYFYVTTDASPARLNEALELLQGEVATLVRDGIDTDTLDDVKRALLLSYAQGAETNAQLAGYYVNSLGELDAHGHFLNHEDRVASVTPEHIREVAGRVLRPENATTALNTPTIGYGRASLLGGLVLLVGVMFARRRSWRGGTSA